RRPVLSGEQVARGSGTRAGLGGRLGQGPLAAWAGAAAPATGAARTGTLHRAARAAADAHLGARCPASASARLPRRTGNVALGACRAAGGGSNRGAPPILYGLRAALGPGHGGSQPGLGTPPDTSRVLDPAADRSSRCHPRKGGETARRPR